MWFYLEFDYYKNATKITKLKAVLVYLSEKVITNYKLRMKKHVNLG